MSTLKTPIHYPEHIQIEPVCGICTARCTMCTINSWTHEKIILPTDKFELLLKSLQNNPRQKFLTLHGLGESLLDKELPEKVKIAKSMGFKGTGFATNCTELDENMSRCLLDSGLDTIICSIDGTTKEVHESIRIGTNFEKVIENATTFIKLRNASNYKTRVLVRLIFQEKNQHQWDDYQLYWNKKLDTQRNDGVLRFDIHNWGDNKKMTTRPINDILNTMITCDDIVDRLFIQASGRVALCCGDDNNIVETGNAFEKNAIDIYNSPPFTTYREAMKNKQLHTLTPCSTCDIWLKREAKILSD